MTYSSIKYKRLLYKKNKTRKLNQRGLNQTGGASFVNIIQESNIKDFKKITN
jgi:hypothetical protein